MFFFGLVFFFFFKNLWQKCTQEKEKHVGFKQAGWNEKAGSGNITGWLQAIVQAARGEKSQVEQKIQACELSNLTKEKITNLQSSTEAASR